ncbi:MAG: HPr family phosphocarrier protein [Negativicutes bacterium]|nr:HPr family phosphocarrier protein [Negativicutes bacterium]
MVEETVVLTNKVGLHARPAALLVKTVNGFTSQVTIVKDGKSINAKSMLSIMGAAIKQGDSVTIQVNGADEQEAISAITGLIRSGFGEN